jgi:hypothetical protein
MHLCTEKYIVSLTTNSCSSDPAIIMKVGALQLFDHQSYHRSAYPELFVVYICVAWYRHRPLDCVCSLLSSIVGFGAEQPKHKWDRKASTESGMDNDLLASLEEFAQTPSPRESETDANSRRQSAGDADYTANKSPLRQTSSDVQSAPKPELTRQTSATAPASRLPTPSSRQGSATQLPRPTSRQTSFQSRIASVANAVALTAIASIDLDDGGDNSREMENVTF